MVLIRSLLWNVGLFFQKIEAQTLNLPAISIISAIDLWQSYNRFNISLQTKPNLSVGPYLIEKVLIRSSLWENLVLIRDQKLIRTWKCQHCI